MKGLAVVLDKGGDTFLAGYADGDFPEEVFPSVTARNGTTPSVRAKGRSNKVGDDVAEVMGLLKSKRPIQRGIVTDWEAMEDLYEYTFSTRMKISLAEHPILLSEKPLNPKQDRTNHTELLFETFGACAIQFGIETTLAVYGANNGSVLIVSCGEGASCVQPYEYFFTSKRATRRYNIGGQDTTESLRELLSERGVYLSAQQADIAKQMKEKHCFVAQDYEQSLTQATQTPELHETYQLPDGQEVTIGSERFRCMEGLFQPSLLGMDMPGLAEMVSESLSVCDVHLRAELLRNIVLCGGPTKAPGFSKRLREEIQKAFPLLEVKMHGIIHGNCYHPWNGGSMLAGFDSFQPMWFSKEEYGESGPLGIWDKKSPAS